MKKRMMTGSTSDFKTARFIIADLILVMIILVVMGLVALVMYNIFGNLNTDIQDNPDFSVENKAVVDDLHTRYPSIFDGIFILALVLFWGFLLVSTLWIDAHPAYFVLALILLIILMFAGAFIGNSFKDFTDDPTFSSDYSTHFPMMKYVMDHFLTFLMIMGFSVLVVLYGKSRAG